MSPSFAGAKMLATLRAEESSGQLQLVEREDIDDDDDLFEAINKLVSQGINAGGVKKLLDAGIYTCNGLTMHTKKNLTGIQGLSVAVVDNVCEAAEKIMNFGYVTGSDALLRRKSMIRVTTGIKALDELLEGGIETLSITEAVGEFRPGKTQLAHTLYVSTQFPFSTLELPTSMPGAHGNVTYIDTEGNFPPDRIVPIAERFGMDPEAVLDIIITYARAYAYEHQYNLLLGLAAKMSEEPFRLLIVDSVIALFRVVFSGRGELVEGYNLQEPADKAEHEQSPPHQEEPADANEPQEAENNQPPPAQENPADQNAADGGAEGDEPPDGNDDGDDNGDQEDNHEEDEEDEEEEEDQGDADVNYEGDEEDQGDADVNNEEDVEDQGADVNIVAGEEDQGADVNNGAGEFFPEEEEEEEDSEDDPDNPKIVEKPFWSGSENDSENDPDRDNKRRRRR